ncbi:hypothetical protein AB0O47_02095 [Streptomyces noursei]|uniref:hypothetical protein n=1 Tax=Streptomyces noursei TaxID=1971 RepID=UPI003450F1C7
MTKLPSDAVLVKMFHLGLSDDEIAAEYGVQRQAVNWRFMQMDPPLHRKPIAIRVTEMVNKIWDVKTDRSGVDTHHNKYAFKNLKVWLRLRLGDSVSASQQASAERFIRRLIRDNTVVDYDRSSPDGWQLVPRVPADGRRIIRWPAGQPLPDTAMQRAMELPESNEPDAGSQSDE